MAEYQVFVDQALCMGHGLCFQAAPTLFSPDADGYNAAAGGGWIALPQESLQAALDAEASCPESAIRIVSSDD